MSSERGGTLKSRQRGRISTAYGLRGRSNTNLWLCYSVKIDRDLIFPSDRQFYHWIYFLETNPLVKSFEIEPPIVLSVDAHEARGVELDARVLLRDGRIEWHEVKSSDSELDAGKSQLQAEATAARIEGVAFRTFSDKDLSSHIRESMRWMKVICYASVLRERPLLVETASLSAAIELLGRGVVQDLLNQCSEYDPELLKGLICRLVILDALRINLRHGSFGAKTTWVARHEMEP